MNEPKVAKILDKYNLVLNKGKNADIKLGQEYLLYEQTEEIRDPETGELLECLFVPKGRGIITRVQDKISILRSNEWERPSSLAEALTAFAQPRDLKPFYRPEIGDAVKILVDIEEDVVEDKENEGCKSQEDSNS